ncbi:MAG: ribosome small subunit-dependent GTPase A [Parabacteroides sp.]|nr:ribosome small subunit-dependent GTPase A [Parabacteroides sp.]
MIDLQLYGWNEALCQLKQEIGGSGLSHGRVMITHKTCYRIVSENGIYICELSGNVLYGKDISEYPCTGDWVLFQSIDNERGIIIDVFPRKGVLYRRKSGTLVEKQPIASFVDKAFIVESFGSDFNVRKIERFIIQILEANICPVLVLNKSDLESDDKNEYRQFEHLKHQMPILKTSIHQPASIQQLRKCITRNETVVFIGSSGVGKSSLINKLCNKSVLCTSEISSSTQKGRHTSTRREMILLDDWAVLIDTPGFREFGLTIQDSSFLLEPMKISDFAKECRFKNCTHTLEVGCAVLDAVNKGLLDKEIYNSYLKLKREISHYSTSEYEKRKKDKKFSKIVDEVKRYKTKF